MELNLAVPIPHSGNKVSPNCKHKRSSDDNESLPDRSQEAYEGSLEFNEVLDEGKLCTKSCVINRAPILTAWSMIVAERLGFKREEALSIGKASNSR